MDEMKKMQEKRNKTTTSPILVPTPMPTPTTPDAIVTPTPEPAPIPVPAKGVTKPFPQHVSYASGIIKPTNVSQSVMDKTVKKAYDQWKAKYLKQPSDHLDQYYISYSPDHHTVSEALGYGMISMAYMAGHDVDAKKYFDGMFRYFKAHPSNINPAFMAWRQVRNNQGRMIDDQPGKMSSATDGDMDIAYALLLADKQWGNNKEYDYKAEAVKIINALMEDIVHDKLNILKMGDWQSESDAKFGEASRSSDWMLNHFRAYEAATGDARWSTVLKSTQGIINQLYNDYSPNTGLLADFVQYDEKLKKFGPVVSSKSNVWMESENDGWHTFNACRDPWRLGTDIVLTGDNTSRTQMDKLNSWIRKSTNDDPARIMAVYKLDGTPVNDWVDMCFTAPFMVSAMVGNENQEWLNNLWMRVATNYDERSPAVGGDSNYYNDSIRLLSLITVSGNWWTP
ncbi:glycosyl hydrolase family 8 [Aneurinibacillus tyrosinisolvens]|uniref:glycosyl hydrolase family 8 n=1 Tax=Aneurinibacillus tyrosinisolvens TaxID=1443435 RepID=UPI003F6FE1EE